VLSLPEHLAPRPLHAHEAKALLRYYRG